MYPISNMTMGAKEYPTSISCSGSLYNKDNTYTSPVEVFLCNTTRSIMYRIALIEISPGGTYSFSSMASQFNSAMATAVSNGVAKQFMGQSLAIFVNNDARLNGSATVTINTELDAFTITVNQPASGGTIATTPSGAASPNSTVTLSNTPASGYVFDHYVVDGTNQVASTFSMPSRAVTVSGAFRLNSTPPTFTANVAPVKVNQAVSDGIYIQGLTKVSASITGAEATAPKTVSGYEISVPGHGSSLQSSFTTATALKTYGNLTVSYKVTDSNGNSTTKTQTINILRYNEPVATINFVRCRDQLGTEDAMGTYIKYKCSVQFTAVDSNAISNVSLRIGNRSWTTAGNTFFTDGNWHMLASDYTIEPASKVDATLIITDKFVTVSIPTAIESANYAIYLNSNGTSIGFGKATEHNNAVEIAAGRTLYLGDESLEQYIMKYLFEGEEDEQGHIIVTPQYDMSVYALKDTFTEITNAQINTWLGLASGATT
jgi:hypothetical protein